MIIFPDKNISPAYFRTAAPGYVLVRTMFHTIQGEGPLAGRPAVFLRLGGCNLGAKGTGAPGCSWCDTDFRVDMSAYLNYEAIKAEAMELIKDCDPPRDGFLYVITGGEPFLQANISGLTNRMLSDQWMVQVETNGMYFQPIAADVIIVCSPKAVGKRYPEIDESMLIRADYFKFLLEDKPDSPYSSLPEWAGEIDQPIYVSPIAVYNRPMTADEGERASAWDETLIDSIQTARNYNYAAAYALKHGLRLSIQQHLFAAIP